MFEPREFIAEEDKLVALVSVENTVRSTGVKIAVHEAHLCGLLPDRTYYYAVGGDGYWGAVHAFKTAPAVATQLPRRTSSTTERNSRW